MTDLPDKRAHDPIYIERNLSIEHFVQWISGTDSASMRQASDGGLTTRLCSIIGPPGSGKSFFLSRLRDRLREAGAIVLWLDVTELGAMPDALIDWLNEQPREAGIESVVDRADATFSASFAAFLRQPGPVTPIVLLVDSFEDISPEWREVLEIQVFEPFLFPPGAEADKRYAVIARRDEYGLQEALLRWEDDVHELKGIDVVVPNGPVEQIRRRLAAVAAAAPAQAGEILEWEEGDGELPGEAVAHVRGLVDAGRDALVSELTESLTGNPYINLALLRRKLLHPDRPLDQADYRACLEAYVRRAGLIEDKEAVIETLADIVKMAAADGSFRMSDYRFEPIRRFIDVMAAGIVTSVPGRPVFYMVDPAVVKLLQHAALIPADATTNP